MNRILVVLGILALAACATSEGSLEVAFTTAETAALAYVQLPACGANAPNPCSQLSIVQKIKDSSAAAYQALLIARKAQTGDSVAAAQQAIVALQDVVNLPDVQATIGKIVK